RAPGFLLSSAAPATPEIYTPSLHDALPICRWQRAARRGGRKAPALPPCPALEACGRGPCAPTPRGAGAPARQGAPSWETRSAARSEEHTSELQSRENLVCRLLLEKKEDTKK